MPTEILLTHNNLKPFRQYGFSPNMRAGKEQVVGNCVFCGKSDKYYINVETKAWDCKSCGKAGGVLKFLKNVWEESKKHFKGSRAKKLSQDRGLEIQTLKDAGIGYFPPAKGYILPVLDYTGEELHSLKIYRNKKLMMTTGDNNILYNGFYLQKGYFNIFLCEGEWDCLAVTEALKKQEKKSNVGDKTTEVAIAVPGAQTFKSEWTSMFSSTNVSVLYDNDKAGREGSGKVYNKLKPICKKINFGHWPTFAKEGEDMRDLYRKVKFDSKKFFNRIKKRLKDLPQDAEKLETSINTHSKPVFEYKGAFIPPKDFIESYRKYLVLEDTEVLEILFATMIANRMGGDPVWLFIVNNSGGSKSELIMSLDDVENVTSLSSMTQNTLISGMETKGGGDPSLIPKLNGRVLLIKDYTTIFSMDKNQQNEITGQLRDAYDGKAAKMYGNGQSRYYESTFGLISGVTPEIERFSEGATALGERFVRFRMRELGITDEKAVQRKAMMNNALEDNMRRDLKDVAVQVLSFDYLKDGPAKIPLEIQDLIIDGALWDAHMRGTVNRNVIGEVTHKANREIATRLTKVLAKLCASLALLRGRQVANMDDFRTVRRVIYSSIPEMRIDALKAMYALGPDKYHEPGSIANITHMTKKSTEKTLDDLMMLKMLERNANKYPMSYKITSLAMELIKAIGVFENVKEIKSNGRSRRRKTSVRKIA